MVRSQNSIPIPHVETGTDIDGQIYMRILFQVPTTEKPLVLLLLRVQLTSLMKNKKNEQLRVRRKPIPSTQGLFSTDVFQQFSANEIILKLVKTCQQPFDKHLALLNVMFNEAGHFDTFFYSAARTLLIFF